MKEPKATWQQYEGLKARVDRAIAFFEAHPERASEPKLIAAYKTLTRQMLEAFNDYPTTHAQRQKDRKADARNASIARSKSLDNW